MTIAPTRPAPESDPAATTPHAATRPGAAPRRPDLPVALMRRRPSRRLSRLRRLPLLALIPLLGLALTILFAGPRAQAAAMPERLLDQGLAATMLILGDDDDAAFLGSGTLWGDGRVVVTTHHVVKSRRSVIVKGRDGHFVPAPVTARDPVRDIAIITLPEPLFGPGLTPADAPLPLGAEVFAIGAPLEIDFTITRGIVSARPRQVEAHVPVRLIQHDAAMNPGSSGGPLIGADGKLHGINARIADGSRLFAGISWAIPVEVVARLIAGDLPPVPQMGLTLRPVTVKIAKALGLPDATGVLVDDVARGGRGWASGIEAGDILLAIDGEAIRTPGDVAMILDRTREGKARVKLIRAGSDITLMLDLAPAAQQLDLTEGGTVAGKVDHYTWERLGVWLDEAGTRVASISRSSPAYRAGLSEGDEILAVDGRPVTDGVHDLRIDRPVLLLIRRHGGRTMHVMVDPWTNTLPGVPVGGANALDPAVSVF